MLSLDLNFVYILLILRASPAILGTALYSTCEERKYRFIVPATLHPTLQIAKLFFTSLFKLFFFLFFSFVFHFARYFLSLPFFSSVLRSLSSIFFFFFFVLPFSSNPISGSRSGGAVAWVSAWRGDDVGLGLEELRLTISALSKPISAWPENFGFGFVCLSKPISDLKILALFVGELC